MHPDARSKSSGNRFARLRAVLRTFPEGVLQKTPQSPSKIVNSFQASALTRFPLPFGRFMDRRDNATRRRILRVALRHFAEFGYSGASVQKIVDDAKITKPTLYYYFRSKAGLFQALIDRAFDERHKLMQKAVHGKHTLVDQLVEMFSSLFEFLRWNRALMRIAFATAFASPGELPPNLKYMEKAGRNYQFIQGLIQEAVTRGELGTEFSTDELAMGLIGMMNIYVMGFLVNPSMKLDSETAQRVTALFLKGAQRAPQ